MKLTLFFPQTGVLFNQDITYDNLILSDHSMAKDRGWNMQEIWRAQDKHENCLR